MPSPSMSLWRTVKEAGVGQVAVVEVAAEEAVVLAVVAATAPVVADMAAARRAPGAADTAVVRPVAMAVPKPLGMAAVTQAECKRGPSMPAPRRMAPE